MSILVRRFYLAQPFSTLSFHLARKPLSRPIWTHSFPLNTKKSSPLASAVIARCSSQSEAKMSGDPFAAVMPKEEIGALRFLKDHPEYDGRDVLVAIFDTGVDPGTQGLQITTDGRPKIVNILDCSGAGDVDTSHIVKADENGCIAGLNGNLLKINPSWKNPTGEWHVGVKQLFSLFSRRLLLRVKKERLKIFEESQRVVVTKANQELADFVKTHPKCTEPEDQKRKAEIETRIKLLETMMSKYEDTGPLLDCVVWHDGENWRAAIDTADMCEGEEEKAKLENFTPLTDFRVEHQFGTFSALDACNFVCNIFEEGTLLSIVVGNSSHGTHVAGITTAYHPENPSFNGIAPGARLISCMIGDTRVGTMETGVGISRAIAAALEHKVDIINFSYGENTAVPNRGRLIELMTEVVYKHNIVWVAAAGNAGPGTSTIGSPADCEALFAVGAYVSPAMAKVAHSSREKLEEGRQYTFSGRGPTMDGRLGVMFSAPGGAISNYPQWTGQCRSLGNGTSMASPNGAGGVALLLSALKQNGRKYCTQEVRKAIENTSQLPEESRSSSAQQLTYGHGLLQVDKAWDYLIASKDDPHRDVRFNVRVYRSDESLSNANSSNGHCPLLLPSTGIYIREPTDIAKKFTYSCVVTPLLHEDADVVEEQIPLEMKIKLTAKDDWVSCPELILVTHSARSFEIQVDTTQVKDDINYTEIVGHPVDAPSERVCLRVPITAINPTVPKTPNVENPYNIELEDFHFLPGDEIKRFVVVPECATWAEITITAGNFEGSRLYFTALGCVLPDVRLDDTVHDPDISLTAGERYISTFPVVGGRMLELCIAQYWISLGESTLSISIEFHGVQIHQGKDLVLNGANGNLRIQVSAPFQREKIQPSVNLNALCIPLHPTDSKLVPFTSTRDALPGEKVIHKLTLTYSLTLAEDGKITPHLPIFNRQVYDCEMEAQMVQIFDKNKKLMLVSDIYPKNVTLKKGEYTLLAMLRHDNPKILKYYEKMILVVEKALDKAISVPVYRSNLDSEAQRHHFKATELSPGKMVTMVIGSLTAELPKDCKPGKFQFQ